MSINQFTERIRTIIERNDIESAISELGFLYKNSKHSNEIILLSARYNDLMRNTRMGMINSENADISRNRIMNDILVMLLDIEKNLESDAEGNSSIDQIGENESNTSIKNAELEAMKTDIASRIANLVHLTSLHLDQSELPEDPNHVEENDFEEIDFKELIKAIEFGNCILFLGPEISVDENGDSLHERFCETRSNEKRKYNSRDGFFMPGAETRLINEAKDYYSNHFPSENKIANALLSKLAQIPFGLIVSLAPDDMMSRIYDQFEKKHHFGYYTGLKQEAPVLNDNLPIIYNALGAACKNGRYIYTHRQFDEYIKNDAEAKFPIEIENKIKKDDTTNCLFIGIDFNKWHNKLLMYELNLLEEVESFAFSSNKIDKLSQEFINRQFNVTFINANHSVFTDLLLRKSKEAGLTKSLNKTVADGILNKLETIRIETLDSDTLASLMEIKQKLDIINAKVS